MKEFHRGYKRTVYGYGTVMAETDEEAEKMFRDLDFKDFPKSDKFKWEDGEVGVYVCLREKEEKKKVLENGK